MRTREASAGKSITVSEIAITGVCIALTFVATGFINIRLPIAANGGLVHLGNVPLFLAILNEFFCSAAGQAFQTADAGGNSAFGYNVEITDIAGFFDVGSAAEFAGEEFFIVAH